MNGELVEELNGRSDMDNDFSCGGLAAKDLLDAIAGEASKFFTDDVRVGVLGLPIFDSIWLSYAWDESLRFCRSKGLSP